MHKSTLQMALEEAASKILVSGICHNNTESITKWVEENLINDNPNTSDNKKIAFYEAEKSLIKKYIAENNLEQLTTLINAIDNEKFKDDPNYQKLKVNECRVLANAIIEAKRYLEEDKSMYKYLHTLLDTKYKELTDEGYRSKISDKITEALSVVQYSDTESSEVPTAGEIHQYCTIL
ncbi:MULTISPECIES: hypothetical protein [Rickettsieae]|uniref:hypothetical protein n=1 Tax=Rickettsieae TaxID=33988 RepID=UPI000B9C6E8D|nr:hypothetical protein [Rickettsia endosymbiont of Culicoides newsteadi]OZG31560.1 hypothetical protein RiCNE_10530 [Rickettsia endosymbiont of Culicoides newsteadi]